MSITYSKFVSFSGPILDLVLLLFVSYVQKRYQPYADIAYDDNYFYYFFQLFTAIYLRFYLPVNRLHAVCFQEFICLTERLAPEESSICGKRTRMRRLQNQMIRIIQHCRFALRRSPPQDKDNGTILPVQCHNRCIGKFFPSDSPMRVSFMRTHSKNRI